MKDGGINDPKRFTKGLGGHYYHRWREYIITLDQIGNLNYGYGGIFAGFIPLMLHTMAHAYQGASNARRGNFANMSQEASDAFFISIGIVEANIALKTMKEAGGGEF